MNNNVSLIVSRCNSIGTIYGDRIVDEKFVNLFQAKEAAKKHMNDGMCTIVRPDYNEKDADGSFFREWRSFNGEPLKEVRFGIPLSKVG